MRNNLTTYKPQDTNYIIKKLIKKICKYNTLLNNSFNWFNKYHIEMTSGTKGFTNVYITDINNHNMEIANFSIDFYTANLSFYSEGYNTSFTDFTINDSIIVEFINYYNSPTISINYTKSDDEILYRDILFYKHQYIEEAVQEAEQYINLINLRNSWIDNINNGIY